MEMLPKKLAIAVTFHFVESRLQYLDMISDHFSALGEDVKVVIVTNSNASDNLDLLTKTLSGKGFDFSFFVPTGLGHPFLLTWSHFAVFREWFTDESFSHFMYVEDDILVTEENMRYWMQGREELREINLIPSFLRVEKKDGHEGWYCSDVRKTHEIAKLPRAKVSDNRTYVNLPTPYQGMYLLDRELMAEHLDGPTSIPEYSKWGIREKAAAGLTYGNVRKGCYSRNFVPVSRETREIEPVCFIHHTPNNYANDLERTDGLGTVLTGDVLAFPDD